ncbi:hypothetical protein CL632_01880 [bacterium]|jgi:hypothetical protein|nr:hypothetical protein [bacterium]MDP6571579.1 hypothetical protein [Patescibacteria group bacterium]MDP6756089.1 hypothetical protein [Patescibacteria group bacterium]|tara:strand:+ start:2663 stop:3088 length:426 start_codon:yes stop_codon:yes gene_type:complete
MHSKKILIAVLAVAILGAGCSQTSQDEDQDDASFVGKVFNGAKQTIGSGAQKGSRFIKESGEGYIRNLTDEQKLIVAQWLAKNKLNEFGDAIGTLYTGGTPLFDELTGESTDRFTYLFEKFPELKDVIKGEMELQAVEIEE